MGDFQAAYRRLLDLLTRDRTNAPLVLRRTSEALVGTLSLTSPQRALLLNLSGTCHALLGQVSEAIDDFEAALRRLPRPRL